MNQKIGRLLTRAEVEARCRINTTSLYRAMRRGNFPAPIRVGVRAVRWSEDEIERYLADPANRATGEVGQPDAA